MNTQVSIDHNTDVQYQMYAGCWALHKYTIQVLILELVIWSCDTGHIGIDGGVDIWSYSPKTKFSRTDGLP